MSTAGIKPDRMLISLERSGLIPPTNEELI